MTNKNRISSLDLSSNASLYQTISVDKLIEGYQNQFGIDVSKFFIGINEVEIYECDKTNYKFYYPFGIDGDSDFYRKLQNFNWYYMPWKWEHEISFQLLKGSEKILEVGSGGLGFLEKMEKHGFDITGLELNEESINRAKENGLNVFNQTIQNHSINYFEQYDVVCSYQVLEHISDVHSFIMAKVNCLKRGGKLIIAVPNNDSFIKFTNGGLLNSPPHHMGLWNKKSLNSITKLFSLKLDKVLYEPLQEYHTNWYINSFIQEKINRNKYVKFVFNKMRLKKIYSFLVKNNRKIIKGHSILAIYTKI